MHDTNHRIDKDRMGPDLDERSLSFSMAPNRAIAPEKSRLLAELHRDSLYPMMGRDAWVAGADRREAPGPKPVRLGRRLRLRRQPHGSWQLWNGGDQRGFFVIVHLFRHDIVTKVKLKFCKLREQPPSIWDPRVLGPRNPGLSRLYDRFQDEMCEDKVSGTVILRLVGRQAVRGRFLGSWDSPG